jgi:hypothetical protein
MHDAEKLSEAGHVSVVAGVIVALRKATVVQLSVTGTSH